MTNTKSRKEYIDAWANHTRSLYTLAFCEDMSLSAEVKEHIDAILLLIPKVADTKNLK